MIQCATGKRLRSLAFVIGAVGACAFLFSTLPAVATEPGVKATARPGPDEARALAKLDDDWSKAAATRNAELVASFYAENAVAYPPGEPVAIGRAAAQKVWAAYFAEPSFAISWTTVRSEVSSGGDMGVTAGAYLATYKDAGGKAVTENGKYLCTWKKQPDGSWKAMHDMWNADAK